MGQTEIHFYNDKKKRSNRTQNVIYSDMRRKANYWINKYFLKLAFLRISLDITFCILSERFF